MKTAANEMPPARTPLIGTGKASTKHEATSRQARLSQVAAVSDEVRSVSAASVELAAGSAPARSRSDEEAARDRRCL
jgi:hypothetical protein